MSAPPVPPRPPLNRDSHLPPPLPPLPPDFRPPPLPAPTPHRFDPKIALSLDLQANPTPIPAAGPRPLPNWNPWNPPAAPTPLPPPHPPLPSVQAPVMAIALAPAPLPYPPDIRDNRASPLPVPNTHRRTASASPAPYPSRSSQSSPQRQPGSIVSPLPSIPTLTAALSTIQQPSHDPGLKITWCRDVLFLVDHLQQNTSPDNSIGPAQIPDTQLARLVEIAVPIVLQVASTQPVPNPAPRYIAEATYHRGTFAASGAYPEFVQQSPRAAFRDFETAARAGYAAAWFKLGRDYENFSDVSHARECFERGVKLGVESCIYRLGMAHLMGQLGLPQSYEQAVPLLHRAATLASLEVPQPAYVYGLLLLGEFSHVSIPPQSFAPLIPPGSNSLQESRRHLERAAYLNFGPAQYKLGHSYEFAHPPFPFDPLLSVQYYSLASQQGEIEADMALSKWFLCGAENAFEKDETLAFTFAEKAARKGLPSAEFAMGYYTEVGVGCSKDVEMARSWYLKAAEHGNADAAERLQALSHALPKTLSRQEHDTITEHKLIRKRTQARQRSDANIPDGMARPGPALNHGEGRRIVEVIRKNSLAAANSSPDYPPQRLPTMPENPTPQPRIQDMRKSSVPDASPNETQPLHIHKGSVPNASIPVDSPRPRPAQPGRHNITQNRYTLTDRPSPQPQQPFDPERRVTSSPVRMSTPEGSGGVKPQANKPTTFAEMGFQSGKADEKDCVIM